MEIPPQNLFEYLLSLTLPHPNVYSLELESDSNSAFISGDVAKYNSDPTTILFVWKSISSNNFDVSFGTSESWSLSPMNFTKYNSKI